MEPYMEGELSEMQAGLRKGRGTRDQIANLRWIMETTREYQKELYMCFIDYSKAFDCVDHDQLWNILMENSPSYSDEEPLHESGGCSENRVWINRMVPTRKRSPSGMYPVAEPVQHV